MTAPVEPTKTKTRRWPVVLFLLLLVGLPAIGAGIFYFGVFHHAPEAHQHMPDNTRIALRADGAKVFAFKPVREHLVPLLLDAKAKQNKKGNSKNDRAKRIKKETGVDIPMDLREVILASADGRSWVMLIGGKIEAGRFVKGMHTVFKEEGLKGWKLQDGMLVHSLGLTLAQADDGTLIVGTTPAIARAALPVTDKPARAPLPVDGALSFLVHEEAWREMIANIPSIIPGVDALRSVEQASGHFLLSSEPRLVVRLDPKAPVKAAKLAESTQSILQKSKLALLLVPSQLGGAKDAIRSAKVEAAPASAPSHVLVTAPWSYAVLERAARDLASVIRAGTGLRGKAPGSSPRPF